MHYYSFHIGDYASHTRHLSHMEDLAFRRLLDFYYLHESPIKTHDIARQIGMREYEQDVLTVLNEFFMSTADGFVNARADKEIEHFHAKVEQASRAGKASAERRSNARSTDVQPTNNHEPVTNNQEPVVKSNRGSRLPAEFSLSDDWKAFCQQERQDLNPHKVFAEFKDYWIAQPGQKGVKTDWDATWRNWVRRQNAPRQNPADIARVTVPSRQERDPALAKLDQDRQLTRPPDLETLAKIAELKRRQA